MLMRILFTRFPLESRIGGSEVQTLSLMKGLAGRGHMVEFLGSCPILLRESAKCEVRSAKLDIGIPPVTKLGAISFFWRKKMMQKQLSHALSSLIPHPSSLEAIVMLSLSEKLLLTDEAVNRGIKVIWIEHDPVGRWLINNPWLSQLRRLSQKVTTIVVSDLSKKIYKDLGYKKVVAIPNGIDLERFAKSENRKTKDHSQIRIGTAARLAEEKGVDVLLEAIRDFPHVNLTIVGEGPEESYLRNFIDDITAREGMDQPRITLVNKVEDLGAFYRSLDVFVLSSRTNDPFGLSAAEAMSLGIATIVTDACGIAGYLSHGTDALIAKADDAESLKEQMKRMMDEETRKRIAESGKRIAEEEFDVKRMVERYEKLMA